MSIDYEIDLSLTCDACGRFVGEHECTILCGKCASSMGKTYPRTAYCSPVLFGDKYTCLNTRRDYKWEGDLPPFCPCCGEIVRL